MFKNPPATLFMLCGKVASGKSTLADRLASAHNTVLLREDFWLSSLYGDELKTLRDYVKFSARLKQAMASHIVALLKGGTSVVLDFPANTKDDRLWMQGLIDRAECLHQLHYLDVPDELCLSRLGQRNASGEHEFSVTEHQFERIAEHFQPPSEDERFNIMVHRVSV